MSGTTPISRQGSGPAPGQGPPASHRTALEIQNVHLRVISRRHHQQPSRLLSQFWSLHIHRGGTWTAFKAVANVGDE